MPVVGIRELKTHASAILRKVRDEGAEYVVTFHGRPVGMLVPLDEDSVQQRTVSVAREVAQAEISPQTLEELKQPKPPRRRARPPEDDDTPAEKPAPKQEKKAPEVRPVRPSRPKGTGGRRRRWPS